MSQWVRLGLLKLAVKIKCSPFSLSEQDRWLHPLQVSHDRENLLFSSFLHTRQFPSLIGPGTRCMSPASSRIIRRYAALVLTLMNFFFLLFLRVSKLTMDCRLLLISDVDDPNIGFVVVPVVFKFMLDM